MNAKAALMRQIAVLNSDGYNTGDAEREVDRVKAIVISKSSGKIKAEDILGNQRDRESVEQTVGHSFIVSFAYQLMKVDFLHVSDITVI